MQNRSLLRIFILNVLTFGMYELVWLSQTRQEMVDKFGAKIPKTRWIVFVRNYQILTYFAAIALLLYFIPASGKAIDAIQRPSPECFISYTQHTDDPNSPLTQSCKNAVDNYFDNKASTQQVREVYTLIACFVTGLLSVLLYARWLNHYAAGVARVTAGKISQTVAMALLLLTPPTIGMIIVQATFNGNSGNSLGNSS